MEMNAQNQESSQMIDESEEHYIHSPPVANPQDNVDQPHSTSDAVAQENASSSVQGTSVAEQKICQIIPEIKEKTVLEKRKDSYTEFKDKILCDRHFYFQKQIHRKVSAGFFNTHSVISKDDEDRLRFGPIFKEMQDKRAFNIEQLGFGIKESRGIAAIMGMAIGDALGASTEFEHFKKEGLGIIKHGFKDIRVGICDRKIRPRSGKINVWTDDASMGLCMADSILLNNYQFDPKHMRFMFVVWLQNGLNNGGRPHSIGLGGNISISMYEFMRKQQDYTDEGHRNNNGNGSLMRLAPVPVAYSDDLNTGITNSGLQSLTTHNGLEAKECCRLMANIIIELINRDKEVDGKQLILKVCNSFKTEVPSVGYLAKGEQQSKDLFEWMRKNVKDFSIYNKKLEDRNWNWRDENHTYSPCRLAQQPGYIGSYCMDALSMALHTVMFTNSFREVVAKNADMGGDCDTVGSIAGQIAGALYGVTDELFDLYSQMDDFISGRYDVFLKAYKLAYKKRI